MSCGRLYAVMRKIRLLAMLAIGERSRDELGLFDEQIIVWDGEEYLGVPYKHEPTKFYLILE